MIKKIVIKTEYFLDIPLEISTTGFRPCRGFYTHITFSSEDEMWVTSRGEEIKDNNWIKILNTYKNNQNE